MIKYPHTPAPWSMKGGGEIYSSFGNKIASTLWACNELTAIEDKANAEHIVYAVNNIDRYESDNAALRCALETKTKIRDELVEATKTYHAYMCRLFSGTSDPALSDDARIVWVKTINAIQSVLNEEKGNS